MEARPPATLAVALIVVAALAVGSARATTTDPCPATPSAPAAGLTVAYPATAALVGHANASVAAVVDAGGGQAQFLVEYGTSTDYGLCTAAAAVPTAAGAQSVAVLLTGLTASTTYHFRVVATGAAGSTAGADEVLTTLPVNEIPQGVTIDGIQVGSLTSGDATAAVRRLIATPARLALGSRRWTVLRTKLGAHIDATGAVASALAGTPGQTLQVPITVDTHALRRYLRAAGGRYGEPAQAPTLALVGRHAVVTKPRGGIALALDRAVSAV